MHPRAQQHQQDRDNNEAHALFHEYHYDNIPRHLCGRGGIPIRLGIHLT